MCPQSVHERLVKLGENRHTNLFTDEEKSHLIKVYEWYADDGGLKDLAADMGRSHTFIAKQARKLGLTKQNRGRPYLAYSTHVQMTKWHQENPHPRGMLGKTHSEETRKKLSEYERTEEHRNKISDSSFKRWHAMTPEQQSLYYGTKKWKSGWREIGGRRIFYRSRWEANYARYLQWLKELGEIADWEHEPQVFWFMDIKRGTRSYLPDFRLTEINGAIAYHEVKGWMDAKSKTKIKRMAKYYPEIKLVVVTAKNYRALARMVCRLIPEWEKET